MIKHGRLIVYSGPSGVGKGTLIEPFITGVESRFKMSVSATTRAPRPGEVDGVHYYFIDKPQFEQMIENNEMLEYACYNGNYYGTPRKYVVDMLRSGRDVVLEIEVQGARSIHQNFPDAVMVFVMPPSFEELIRRLENRGTETQASLQNRLNIAINEMTHARDYDFVIVNDDINRARSQLLEVVGAAGALSRFNHNLIKEVLKDAETCNERYAQQ